MKEMTGDSQFQMDHKLLSPGQKSREQPPTKTPTSSLPVLSLSGNFYGSIDEVILKWQVKLCAEGT